MATKTALQNAIDTALSIVITKAKVLTGLDNIIDELFPTTVNIVDLVSDVGYRLKIRKTGSNVTIDGSFTNYTASIQGSQTVIDMTGEAYSPKNQLTRIPTNNGYNIIFNNNLVLLEGNLGVGETIYINGNYQTND